MGLEIIKVLMKEKKITQDKLAELSGVPKGTLSKITAGITDNPKLETLRSITDVLGCTLDDLVDSSPNINTIRSQRSTDTYTDKEKKLVENYRKLRPEHQGNIEGRMELYLEEYAKEVATAPPTGTETAAKSKFAG